MKYKIVLFFNYFGLFFSKRSFLSLQNFISLSIKYPVSLIFYVVVCICKIHVFNGVIPCQIMDHVTFISWVFLKLSPVVGITEI